MVTHDQFPVLIYLGLLLLVWVPYGVRRRRSSARSRAVLDEARASGLFEPPSLHPLIDESLCLGCGSCVPVCPEGEVLGLIDGKAELIKPANCIGHGACAGGVSPGCDHAGSGDRNPGHRHSGRRAQLRNQRARDLRGRRARGHGPDSQRDRAGSPGDRIGARPRRDRRGRRPRRRDRGGWARGIRGDAWRRSSTGFAARRSSRRPSAGRSRTTRAARSS